ncbi:MAG: hypothetical protein LBU79_03040 [Planctomycetota bacterium]|jgi:hypothetical protein|nr:hypothetical protein [Planctomycetota bacterium]
MRNALGLAIILCFALPLPAAEPTLADLVPATTIACLIPPDDNALEQAFTNSIFRFLGELPEMAPFLGSLAESRQHLAATLMNEAGLTEKLARELVNARFGAALLNLSFGPGGEITPEIVMVAQLPSAPDRNSIFNAVRLLLNRPAVVQKVLKNQGLDPNLPLVSLAQEENYPGFPPLLRIGPNLRIAVLGRLVVVYHGPGSGAMRTIFDTLQNPAQSLTHNLAYQETLRGSGATPGMAFTFVNLPRLIPLLDAGGLTRLTRVLDTIGLAGAQSLGLASGYQKTGITHNLYLYSPGRLSGVFAALRPANPQAGMELYSKIVPAPAAAFLALRLDLSALLAEGSYLAEGIRSLGGGDLRRYLEEETLLGVPLLDLASVLGEDVVLRPHNDSQVLLFSNVDTGAIRDILARMERNTQTSFSVVEENGYQIHYFRPGGRSPLPLTPAFCLIPKQQSPGRALLYVASHPQALVSLIREAMTSKGSIASSQDFQTVAEGMGGGYSLFYYADSRESYRRFYNFLLPLASLLYWTGDAPPDAGLLPVDAELMPHFFGCAFGIKPGTDGVALQFYSPVGVHGFLIFLVDRLVLSNPLVLSWAYSTSLELGGYLPW